MGETSILPTAVIHSAGKCMGGITVHVGAHVVELRHIENLRPNVPVLIGLCVCCELMSHQDMRAISDVAISKYAPAHAMRQIAVSKGAEIVTEKQLREHLKVGRTKLWDLVKSGGLPEPMKRGQNNIWLLDEALARYAQTLQA